MALLGWVLDRLLGAKCAHGCGYRVYPKDRVWHTVEHCREMAAWN